MDRTDIILQLNFPFCFHKCSYCSHPTCSYDAGVLHKYADAMVREIEAAAPDFADRRITAISIEGGCPGLMLPADLQKVVMAVQKNFCIAEDVFFSIETMPGEYSRALLDRMRDRGVNHWIFNIPTANDSLHYLLNRPYNIDTISQAHTAIENFPVRDLCFELLYGIPGQTVSQFLSDIKRMLDYMPEHFTLDPFRIEEGTEIAEKIKSGKLAAVSPEAMADMYKAAKDLLVSMGYRAYTNRDFALPGKENRFRLARLLGAEQLGIGYHAVSFIDGMSYENGHSLQEYLEHSDDISVIAANAAVPDSLSLLKRDIYTGLSLAGGVSAEKLAAKYSDVSADTAVTLLSDLTAKGYVSFSDGVYTLTELGIVSENEIRKVLA